MNCSCPDHGSSGSVRFKRGATRRDILKAALGGVGLTHLTGGIGPGEASVMKSVRYVAVVAVGGMGSLWGTLATSALLTFLSLRGTFGTYDDAVFAAILLAVMLFSPDGILKLQARSLARALLHRVRPPPGVEAP